MTARAKTEQEVREQFLEYISHLVEYWSEQKNRTDKEKCNGLVFSILNIFDGTSSEFPAMDVLLSPHPEDKAFHQKEGKNWFESGMMINNCMLHELWGKYENN